MMHYKIKIFKKKLKGAFAVFSDSSFERKYQRGNSVENDNYYKAAILKNKAEALKEVKRFDVINHCLKSLNRETTYLEIGVRFPEANFDKIKASFKYSVDPGFENALNPVDFKLTSDQFFNQLKKGEILSSDIKFDLIFIDGLHLAHQVDKDIENSLAFLKEDGFIVLHDCNPPTAFHARENQPFSLSPAGKFWNGTTWKAFYKYRLNEKLYSCCVDSDWGIGVISTSKKLYPKPEMVNEFFEYNSMDENRTQQLGLVSFEEFKAMIG